MKTTANVATYPPRLASIKKMIESIYPQFDEIRIYWNEYDEPYPLHDPDEKIINHIGENLTDNGKFFSLDHITDPEYFFTLDDDLMYPPQYVQKSIDNIEKYNCIVTYHGRKLLGKGLKYYTSHQHFHCLNKTYGNLIIDVLGSGVAAWSTDYFHPKGLANHKLKCMSDLILSHEAAKQGKKIGIMEHDAGWIKHIDNEQSIWATESQGDQSNQIKLADQIYSMNYENKRG